MRQIGAEQGRNGGQVPAAAERVAHRLPPVARVVAAASLVALERRLVVEQQVALLVDEDGREEAADERHRIVEHVELRHREVQAEEQHRDGHEQAQHVRPVHLFDQRPDEPVVEVAGVHGGRAQVHQEQVKVAEVVEAYAAASEGAVVLALQDACLAHVAVPGPRRRQGLARGAQVPALVHIHLHHKNVQFNTVESVLGR